MLSLTCTYGLVVYGDPGKTRGNVPYGDAGTLPNVMAGCAVPGYDGLVAVVCFVTMVLQALLLDYTGVNICRNVVAAPHSAH